jgi:small conductance mechanosensitive channel
MVTLHDWLASASSPTVQLAVTALALAAVAAGLVALRLLHRRLRGGLVARTVALLAGLGYLALVGGAAAAVLTVWGLSGEAEQFLATERGRQVARRILLSVLTGAGAYFLVGVSRRAVDEFVESRLSVSTHEGHLLFRAVQAAVYGLAALGVLGIWRLGLTNLLISAGVLGVVLGLAAQKTLGAVIAGFVIMLSRPFEVGDFVEVGGQEGTVTDVTLVNTRLRTLDGEHVSIPNDVVEDDHIVNYSRDGRLSVHVEVDVDFDADVERAGDAAVAALADIDASLDRPAPDYDVQFGDSGMTLDLRFAIEDPTAERRRRAHRTAVAAVKAALEDAGVAIPFPQREVSARGGDGFDVHAEPVDGAGADGGSTPDRD